MLPQYHYKKLFHATGDAPKVETNTTQYKTPVCMEETCSVVASDFTNRQALVSRLEHLRWKMDGWFPGMHVIQLIEIKK
jgi:hypothetical protein